MYLKRYNSFVCFWSITFNFNLSLVKWLACTLIYYMKTDLFTYKHITPQCQTKKHSSLQVPNCQLAPADTPLSLFAISNQYIRKWLIFYHLLEWQMISFNLAERRNPKMVVNCALATTMPRDRTGTWIAPMITSLSGNFALTFPIHNLSLYYNVCWKRYTNYHKYLKWE